MKRLSVAAAGLGASGLLVIDEAGGAGSGSLWGEDGLLPKNSSFSHLQLPPVCANVKTHRHKCGINRTRITVTGFQFSHLHLRFLNLFLYKHRKNRRVVYQAQTLKIPVDLPLRLRKGESQPALQWDSPESHGEWSNHHVVKGYNFFKQNISYLVKKVYGHIIKKGHGFLLPLQLITEGLCE